MCNTSFHKDSVDKQLSDDMFRCYVRRAAVLLSESQLQSFTLLCGPSLQQHPAWGVLNAAHTMHFIYSKNKKVIAHIRADKDYILFVIKCSGKLIKTIGECITTSFVFKHCIYRATIVLFIGE